MNGTSRITVGSKTLTMSCLCFRQATRGYWAPFWRMADTSQVTNLRSDVKAAVHVLLEQALLLLRGVACLRGAHSEGLHLGARRLPLCRLCRQRRSIVRDTRLCLPHKFSRCTLR